MAPTRRPRLSSPRRLGPGHWSALLASLLIIAAGSFSCRSSKPIAQRATGDEALRVGDEVVRVAEVQAQVDAMSPATRARYASPEERRVFFDKVRKNEILAAEARRLGYDQAPEVVTAMKKAMVLKLLKERI